MHFKKVIKKFQRKAPNRIILFLQKIPLFENLSFNELIKMRKTLKIHTFANSDIIFTQNSKEKGIYFILVGKAHILKKIKNKEYELVAELDREDFFGEFNFLDKPFDNIVVKAASNLEAFYLSQKDFEKLKKNEPRIAVKVLINLIKILGERLIKINSDYLNMAYQHNPEESL